MSKYNFMKRAFLWTAILSAVAFVLVGIFSPIEAGMSIFGHVLKCIFGWAWVTVILETIVYSGGQFFYWWMDDHKDKYGKGWFWKGIKEDIQNLKTDVDWRKVAVTYIVFAVVFFSVVGILELLVP